MLWISGNVLLSQEEVHGEAVEGSYSSSTGAKTTSKHGRGEFNVPDSPTTPHQGILGSCLGT